MVVATWMGIERRIGYGVRDGIGPGFEDSDHDDGKGDGHRFIVTVIDNNNNNILTVVQHKVESNECKMKSSVHFQPV